MRHPRDLLNSHRENHVISSGQDKENPMSGIHVNVIEHYALSPWRCDTQHLVSGYKSITAVTKFITLYLKALLSLVWLFQLGPLILSTGSNYSKLKWNWDLFDGNRIGLAIIKMRFLPALIFTHRTLPKRGRTQGQQVGGERKRAPENHSS